MPVVGVVRDGDDDEEHVSIDMCTRVEALSPEAALIVRWALRMEGALHRIEEFPEHEPHYPMDERYSDPRKLAAAALHAPINKSFKEHMKRYQSTPLGQADLPPITQ